MRRRQLLEAIGTIAIASLAGCQGDDSAAPTTGEPTTGATTGRSDTTMTDLTLSSPAFDAGEPIPEQYGKAYENSNPPLTIGGVPDEAESLTLIVDDPDAPGGTFLHWLVWNIPPETTEIPAGWEPPAGVVQGENDFGDVGYGGPRPPSEHTYRFKLYAVDTTLDLSNGAGVQAVTDAMDGHVVGQDELTGTFAP